MHDVDPSNSTSLAVSRKGFVALSSGAAFAGASLARAAAQSMELGKVHPPLVPEDDPAIVAAWIPKGNDLPVRTYTARPKSIATAMPGVVMSLHIWGVDTTYRDIARRLAKDGYVVAIPDLFEPLGAPSGDDATDYSVFLPYAKKLQPADVDAAFRAGAQWIHALAPAAKVAVMGYCMGGTIAWRQTLEGAAVFSAGAIWYGDPSHILPRAAEIRIPVYGSFGERDTGIPAATVREVEAALKVPHDIKIYPEAGHAFFDDQRQSYVPSAANDAWERLTNFFAKYLAA